MRQRGYAYDQRGLLVYRIVKYTWRGCLEYIVGNSEEFKYCLSVYFNSGGSFKVLWIFRRYFGEKN